MRSNKRQVGCGYVAFVGLWIPLFSAFHSLALTFLPTRLSLESVSQSYPSTLMRTLFSSSPKREFAIRNVTLHLEAEMLLILGASSSGKSTILRLVAQMESPVSGNISWYPPMVRPVYLDSKPSPDNSRPIRTILNKLCENSYLDNSWEDVVAYICEIVGLNARDLESTSSALSPSEQYRFGLACACLESIIPAITNENGNIPSPILLLDEWMDLETSGIVHRVQESICNLTRHGAVVLCVTHKPKMFSGTHQSVTMCRGEILFESEFPPL